MANKEQDPFPIAQAEVVRQCSMLEQKLDSLPSTWSLDRKKALLKEVSAGIESVNELLSSLRGALEAAAADKEKFKLTSDRRQERQKWLQATSQRILVLQQRHKAAGAAPVTKLQFDEPAHTNAMDSNGAFLASQTHAQEQLIAQQDSTLDDMSQSLDRILHMGQEVKQQLAEHDKELKALEGDVDSAYSKMRQAIGKMKKLIRS